MATINIAYLSQVCEISMRPYLVSKITFKFKKKIENMQEHRVIVTRHSNLSANAHCIFHLYVGRAHAEKSIESRHPTLLALRNIIRESAQVI